MIRLSPRTQTRTVAQVVLVIVVLAFLGSGIVGGSDATPVASSAECSGADAEAKNVILLIGDGMGQAHIDAARWAKAGNDPETYSRTTLAMDRLDSAGNVSTSAADEPVTDSAAAATALLTGFRTNNGVLGQDATAVTGVSDGVRLDTIAEQARASGRATGVVSTMRLTHATPAGVYAHVHDRDNQMRIGEQLLDADLDVALGGGYRYLVGQATTDPWGARGIRTDGRNLVAEAQAKGYRVVTTAPHLAAVPVTPGMRVLGLFNSDHLHFELERTVTTEPSLAAMAARAIAVLAQDPDGFFLMVEGGLIDTASHANNYTALTSEVLAFDDAVETALTFAGQRPDTLLIVVGDHETGGLILEDDGDGGVSESFTTVLHTASDVPIRASGPGADRFDQTRISNTQVCTVMRDAMGLAMTTIPGGTGVPRSIDVSGAYQDVNGNGRADFADVVLYFNRMSWIAANEPVCGFDYNGNGRIDFADVVWLFNNLSN